MSRESTNATRAPRGQGSDLRLLSRGLLVMRGFFVPIGSEIGAVVPLLFPSEMLRRYVKIRGHMMPYDLYAPRKWCAERDH